MLKKTILITGSCGRIGSAIVNALFNNQNYNLILVDSNKTKLNEQKKKFVLFLRIHLFSKLTIS